MTFESESDVPDPIEDIIEEFLDGWRRGENPPIPEYEARHPEHAEQIAKLFPALLALENLNVEESEGEVSKPSGSWSKLEQLGEYRLLREIGRGGMGIVFEAEQESLGRRVALKVLPQQVFADEVHLERFRREARVAARLHHTNIVPVFGVGEDAGVSYYAMQYIHGQTLVAVLDEVRRLRNAEPLPERWPVALSMSGSVARTLVTPELSVVADAEPTLTEISETKDLPAAATSRLAPTAETLGEGLSERSASHSDAASPSPARTTDSLLGNGNKSSSVLVARRTYYHSVANLGLQIAEALAYAHAEGVLHRDIKPANLLLDTRGVVWITDFGLAKDHESSDLTAAGNVVGTLRYMAPERFDGVADARGDVYSLGITLYEFLALRPAFESSDRPRLIQEIANREPLRPQRVDPSVPRDLETIVLKSIAKNPRDRYGTARELADDLRRFLSFQPIAARRTGITERIGRWCQRNPAVAVLSGLSLLLAIAVVIVSVFMAVRLRKERDESLERFMDAKLAEGRAWRFSRAPGQRIRALEALRETAPSETISVRERRNELIASWSLTDLEELALIPTRKDDLAVSPGLERFAILGDSRSIEVYDYAAPDSPIASLRGEHPWFHYATKFSETGRYLLARPIGRSIQVWDVDAQRKLFEFPGSPKGSMPAVFLPGERQVVGLDEDGALQIRSLPEGDVVEDDLISSPDIAQIVASHDGRLLAFRKRSGGGRVVHVFDLETAALIGRLHHRESVRDMDFDPVDKRLAVASFDRKIHVWDLDSMTRWKTLEGHLAEVTRVAFSPDGRLLASSGWGNRARLWDAHTGEHLLATFGYVTSFSRDSSRLGQIVHQVGHGAWRVHKTEEFRTLRLPSAVLREKPGKDCAVSPDSRWIAASCGLTGVRVWSLQNPDKPVQIPCSGKAVDFDPGGDALLISSASGLSRWPIRFVEERGRWIVGPPEQLGQRGDRFDVSHSGRYLAGIHRNDTIVVYDRSDRWQEVARYRHAGAHRIELSVDGRMAVSSTWHGSEVIVRDLAAKENKLVIPARSAIARFSADSRWIGIGDGSRVRIIDATSGETRHEWLRDRAGNLPAPVAFSSDSRFFAFARSRLSLEICDVRSGASVATFQDPILDDISSIQFSPDTSHIVCGSESRGSLKVWNLGRIRARLRELGLDWEPPAAKITMPPLPTDLEVDPGEFVPAPSRQRSIESEYILRLLESLSARLEFDPSSEIYAERAELHARLEAPDEAVSDLDHALDLAPNDVDLLERRAEILEQLGRQDEARRDRERMTQIESASAGSEVETKPAGH